MIKQFSVLTLFFLLIISSVAQRVTNTYYKDPWRSKMVPREKASYVETVTYNIDSTITTEVRNLKTNSIYSSETLKGEEPFGIWKYSGNRGEELDYSFQMNYRDTVCNDTIPGLRFTDYFDDNDTVGYKAPRMPGSDMTMMKFIRNNVRYPAAARENGIMGRVYLRFAVSPEGKVERISVVRGVHPSLDKEAVRVIRKLTFLNPPTLRGIPQSFCISLPINFALR